MQKTLLVILISLILIIPGEFTVSEAFAKAGHSTPRAKSATPRPAKTTARSTRGGLRTAKAKSRSYRAKRGRSSPAQNYRANKRQSKTVLKAKAFSRASPAKNSNAKRLKKAATSGFDSKTLVKRIKAAKLREINSKRERRNKIWRLHPTVRGQKIEQRLAKTDYRNWYNVGNSRKGKFPLVDFQKGKNLVSLKTVDTRGSSWKREMRKHIYDLGSREATVSNHKAKMHLDMRVMPGQKKDAYHLIEYGKQNGVVVTIREY